MAMLQFPRLLHFSSTFSDLDLPLQRYRSFLSRPFIPSFSSNVNQHTAACQSFAAAFSLPVTRRSQKEVDAFFLPWKIDQEWSRIFFSFRAILLSFSSTDLPFLSHRFFLILIIPAPRFPWPLYAFSLSSCLCILERCLLRYRECRREFKRNFA